MPLQFGLTSVYRRDFYRSVSEVRIYIIAEMISIDLMAIENHYVYEQETKDDLVGILI